MSSKREKASRHFIEVIRPMQKQMRRNRISAAKDIFSRSMESLGRMRRDNRLQRKQLRRQQKRG